MDPGALLRPVGPHPAWVYWLRRAVPLVLLVVVIVALARACGADAHEAGRPVGAPASPSSSITTSPTATRPAAAAPGSCPRSRLSVTAGTDADSYGPGGAPRPRPPGGGSGGRGGVVGG